MVMVKNMVMVNNRFRVRIRNTVRNYVIARTFHKYRVMMKGKTNFREGISNTGWRTALRTTLRTTLRTK